MLADGLTFLASTLKANVSETVMYRRGTKSCSIKATFGSSMLRVASQGVSKIERPATDFKFRSADLNFSDGNGQVEPADGDVVEVTYGTIKKRFRLTPINNGHEPSWRYCDPFQIMVRCHAEQISQSDLTAITITPQTLTDATVSVSYSQQMVATGGLDDSNYVWSQTGLPTGLSMSSSGLITGTTTQNGVYSVTITARDAVSDSGSQLCSLSVFP